MPEWKPGTEFKAARDAMLHPCKPASVKSWAGRQARSHAQILCFTRVLNIYHFLVLTGTLINPNLALGFSLAGRLYVRIIAKSLLVALISVALVQAPVMAAPVAAAAPRFGCCFAGR